MIRRFEDQAAIAIDIGINGGIRLMDAIVYIPYQLAQGLVIFSLFYVGQELFQFILRGSILQVLPEKICQFVLHNNNDGTISPLNKTKQELALPIPRKN